MARRKLFERPFLHFEEEREEHRVVTWLELFFDLFFVVSIAQLTHALSAHPTWYDAFKFVALFIPVWWVWIGFTYYNERFESNGLENRLFTFALMVPIIGLAVFAHHGLDETFQGFVLSYVVARIIITFLWLRGTLYVPAFRAAGMRFVIGFSLSIIIATLAAFSDGTIRYVLFGLALTIDILSPFTTLNLHDKLPRFSSSKLPERFGLFVIIVLGEMVVGIVSGLAKLDHFTNPLIIETILGVALGLGMWWVYFDFIGRRSPREGSGWAFAWGYLHLPLVMTIAATGAGVANVIGHDGTLSE
ncbi:MAG: low temperature requirement protein A, partial [Saprospiraceae bacterium]|nr:low temperature requirement protein A [Saprospiraceae bacterium]